jgi:hypothetical protein
MSLMALAKNRPCMPCEYGSPVDDVLGLRKRSYRLRNPVYRYPWTRHRLSRSFCHVLRCRPGPDTLVLSLGAVRPAREPGGCIHRRRGKLVGQLCRLAALPSAIRALGTVCLSRLYRKHYILRGLHQNICARDEGQIGGRNHGIFPVNYIVSYSCDTHIIAASSGARKE